MELVTSCQNKVDNLLQQVRLHRTYSVKIIYIVSLYNLKWIAITRKIRSSLTFALALLPTTSGS